MTNKDAIKWIKAIKEKYIHGGDESFDECRKEALDMAIKALEFIDERTQGEWEDYSVNFYKCPECGYLLNKDCPCCQNKVILPKGGF